MIIAKLFIGPVSFNVIDAVLYYSVINNVELGLIPTRRQVDFKYHYVTDTESFLHYVKSRSNKIILERDHAGPDQGVINDDGIESLVYDANHHFDLIHLDPFKRFKEIDAAAAWTRNAILKVKTESKFKPSTIRFEIGTEEAIRPYTLEELALFLKIIDNYLDDIEYIVVQTGAKINGISNNNSLSKPDAKKMIDLCHSWGIKAKEHNGDFLPGEGVVTRFDLGLDAINIGPELGILETDCILNSVSPDDKEALIEILSSTRKWQRWLPSTASDLDKARFAGHYLYDKPEFLQIKYKYPHLNHEIIKTLMEKIDIRCSQCGR